MKLFLDVPREPKISCEVHNFERLECKWEPKQTIHELLLFTTTTVSWNAGSR